MEFNELWKKWNHKISGKHKKIFDLTLVIACIGVLLILAGGEFLGSFFSSAKKVNIEKVGDHREMGFDKEMEEKISHMLSNIEGAGQVDVLITFERSIERVYAYETRTNHSESARDQRLESDKEFKIAYHLESDGSKKPVLLKEIHPTPKGVVLIAEGANNPAVSEKLKGAITVLLKIPTHNVQVLPRRKP
jgi:stage III sporulation protein AG